MCVLYVTLPGGDPMIMDAGLLDLMRQVAEGSMMEDEGVGEVCLHLKLATPVDPAVLHGIQNAVSLAAEGIMPAYDAAQDLVRVTRPSERVSVRETWTLQVDTDDEFTAAQWRRIFRPE